MIKILRCATVAFSERYELRSSVNIVTSFRYGIPDNWYLIPGMSEDSSAVTVSRPWYQGISRPSARGWYKQLTHLYVLPKDKNDWRCTTTPLYVIPREVFHYTTENLCIYFIFSHVLYIPGPGVA